MKKYLKFPPPGNAPQPFPGIASSNRLKSPRIDPYKEAQVSNPCFNPYNIRDKCPQPTDQLNGVNTPCFDRQDVKKAINAPLDITWAECGGGSSVNGNDESDGVGSIILPRVIDKISNVIIAGGNMDVLLPPNGNLLGIQNMTWSGKLGFQTVPREPLYVPRVDDGTGNGDTYYGALYPAPAGVLGTARHERGLWYVVAAISGHEGPEYATTAAFRHFGKLLGRVDSLNEVTPFTLPETRSVTQPTGPLEMELPRSRSPGGWKMVIALVCS